MSLLPPKRIKLAIALAVDSIELEQCTENSAIPIISALTASISMQTLIFLSAVSLYREDHVRMPGYSEEWISKYIEYDFYKMFRMSRETFSKLTSTVANIKETYFKVETWLRGRKVVSLEKTLLITIWYLAKGDTHINISERFNITVSTVNFVTDKCLKYILKMMDSIIRWPFTQEQRELISKEFEDIAGYPGVIGAIDGCHIPIKSLTEQHDSYQNRKFFHSINLQAVCTASNMLTNVFVGFPGAANDARVFKNCTLYKEILANGSEKFFGTDDKYHIIGDSAYILLPWLMKPYDETKHTTRRDKLHNFRLSQTRVKIEHSFSFLKGRWLILKYINVNNIKKAIMIVVACCILHNFCLLNKDIFLLDNKEIDAMEQEHVCYYAEDQQIIAKRKRNLIRDGLS